MPGFGVYGASKAAIRNFARHWILDLKQRLIRVNAISPGISTIQRLGRTGDLPEPQRYGHRTVRHRVGDIRAFARSLRVARAQMS